MHQRTGLHLARIGFEKRKKERRCKEGRIQLGVPFSPINRLLPNPNPTSLSLSQQVPSNSLLDSLPPCLICCLLLRFDNSPYYSIHPSLPLASPSFFHPCFALLACLSFPLLLHPRRRRPTGVIVIPPSPSVVSLLVLPTRK